MALFEKTTLINAAPEVVWAFHEAPDALERLTPAWMPMRLVERRPPTGLAAGTRVVVELRLGPFRQRIVAEHTACEPPRMFQDAMRGGPFRRWVHTHRIEPDGEGGTVLSDRVEYALPFGWIGAFFGGWLAHWQLERLFEYRHRVTREACEAS